MAKSAKKQPSKIKLGTIDKELCANPDDLIKDPLKIVESIDRILKKYEQADDKSLREQVAFQGQIVRSDCVEYKRYYESVKQRIEKLVSSPDAIHLMDTINVLVVSAYEIGISFQMLANFHHQHFAAKAKSSLVRGSLKIQQKSQAKKSEVQKELKRRLSETLSLTKTSAIKAMARENNENGERKWGSQRQLMTYCRDVQRNT